MLRGALYSSDGQDLKVSVERTEVLLKSDQILNFPRIIELEGDRLVLAYGQRADTRVSRRARWAVSEDFWTDMDGLPSRLPYGRLTFQTSGILGYMRGRHDSVH